jgi:hypothetical protein
MGVSPPFDASSLGWWVKPMEGVLAGPPGVTPSGTGTRRRALRSLTCSSAAGQRSGGAYATPGAEPRCP